MRLKLATVLSGTATAFIVFAAGIALSLAAAFFMARQIEDQAGVKFGHVLPWATLAVGIIVSLLLFGLIRSLATSGRREHEFQATFDQAAVGIAHFDLQHRNIKVNRRYCEIVG